MDYPDDLDAELEEADAAAAKHYAAHAALDALALDAPPDLDADL